MQRTLLTLILVLSCLMAKAIGSDEDTPRMKAYPGGRHYMVRLVLKDKHDSPGSLERPEEYLSQKAIERRQRQGLSVDSTDLPLSREYMQQIEAQGVKVVCVSRWNNSVVVMDKSKQKLKQLQKLPFVASSRLVWQSPDSIRATKPSRQQYRPDFNLWDDQPVTEYGATKAQTDMVKGSSLHRQGYTGKGMTIAVLDGGFMNVDRIPAFKDVKICGTKDFVYPQDKNVYTEIDHGTKVLSTMAIDIPKLYVGAAPEASYWLFRTEDSATEQMVEEDYWTAAAEYADSVGVDVLTSSLGYHHYDHKDMNYVYADLDGHKALISNTASMLASKGIVMINSAGNDGMGSWKKINVPADADNILTVGAVTPKEVNAGFSSIGPTADGRIKPDVMAQGSPTAVVTGRGTLMKDTGTSFAAPQIAGFVACLWQAHPDLTAYQIIDLVRSNATNHSTPDNIMGYGIADFSKK